MSGDTEPLPTTTKDTATKSSFVEIISDAVKGVQYKLFIMMFLFFLFLSSDTFVNRALSRIDGAVDYKTPTSYGTSLQGLFLVMACMIADIFINLGVV